MATNADTETEVEKTEVSTDLEAELREAKAEGAKPEAEETDKGTQSPEPAEAKEQSEATFTKEVPSISGETPEEYYKNLATAYQESTKEALRLKGELDKKDETPPTPEIPSEATGVLTPEQLYIKQILTKESDEAFAEIVQKYPQVKDPDTYKRFTDTAKVLSKTIVDTDQRFPLAKELYSKTAVILGLTPDSSNEDLGAALKEGASSTKTASSTPAGNSKSKVTEEMISINERMYPHKSRAEIIEELEPHVQ